MHAKSLPKLKSVSNKSALESPSKLVSSNSKLHTQQSRSKGKKDLSFMNQRKQSSPRQLKISIQQTKDKQDTSNEVLVSSLSPILPRVVSLPQKLRFKTFEDASSLYQSVIDNPQSIFYPNKDDINDQKPKLNNQKQEEAESRFLPTLKRSLIKLRQSSNNTEKYHNKKMLDTEHNVNSSQEPSKTLTALNNLLGQSTQDSEFLIFPSDNMSFRKDKFIKFRDLKASNPQFLDFMFLDKTQQERSKQIPKKSTKMQNSIEGIQTKLDFNQKNKSFFLRKQKQDYKEISGSVLKTENSWQKKMSKQRRVTVISQKQQENAQQLLQQKENEQLLIKQTQKLKQQQEFSQENRIYQSQRVWNFCWYPPVIDRRMESREQGTLTVCGDKLWILGGFGRHLIEQVVSVDLQSDEEACSIHEVAQDVHMPRFGHSCVSYKKNLFIYGGYRFQNNKSLDSKFLVPNIKIFDTLKKQFMSNVKTEYIQGRVNHAVCVVGKFMIVHGGLDQSEKYLNDVKICNLEHLRWIPQMQEDLAVQDANPVVCSHTMAAVFDSPSKVSDSVLSSHTLDIKPNLNDGMAEQAVYLFGGRNELGVPLNSLRKLRLGKILRFFNVETIGKPPIPRHSHGMVYEKAQKVLIIYAGRNDYPSYHIIEQQSLLLKQSKRNLSRNSQGQNLKSSQDLSQTVQNPKNEEHYLNDIHVLDMRYLVWCQVRTNQKLRGIYNFGIAEHNQCLYIFGGIEKDGFALPEVYKLEVDERTTLKISQTYNYDQGFVFQSEKTNFSLFQSQVFGNEAQQLQGIRHRKAFSYAVVDKDLFDIKAMMKKSKEKRGEQSPQSKKRAVHALDSRGKSHDVSVMTFKRSEQDKGDCEDKPVQFVSYLPLPKKQIRR